MNMTAKTYNTYRQHQDKTLATVAYTLRECIENEGITQTELARRLGCSPRWVNKLCSGKRNMTLSTMADAFLALDKAITFRVEEF